MIRQFMRTAMVALIATQLITAAWATPLPAAAGTDLIDTQSYSASIERQERLDRVQSLLAEERVQEQLEAFGVTPEEASERVQSLTASELAALDGKLDEMPAGAGAVTIIGVVFVVLLVLELVGVTNIFVAI